MPCKKKKYNARFPAGRIKKIMQTDEEVGKVAQAVPVIISRTLELFVHSLLTKTMQITNARNAKTLRPSHMKQCILSESRFDFLKDLVKGVPDVSATDDDVPTPPLTPAPMGGNVIPGATTGSAPIVHSDGRVSEEMTNWSRTTSRNSRNSKDSAEMTILGGDTDEYTKVYVAGTPSATMTTETRPSSLQPTQQLLHQHQHQQHQQVPNFQITVPSSFHVNQPNFYTELDSTSNNNSLNAVNQPTSNFNHTANIDEDYDT